MIKCKCGSELKVKEFTYYFIEYCENCHNFTINDKLCLHDRRGKTPIKFKLSNGAYQLRLFCPICKILESKSQKQSDYNLEKIKETTFENFEKYKKIIQDKESKEFSELLANLRSNKVKSIREIYNTYIKSDAWKEKRNFVLLRDQNICQICGKKAMDIHHLTYAHLEREYLFELIALCRECHLNEYHKDKNINDPDIEPNTSFENETPF